MADRPASALRSIMLLALGRLILHCVTNGQYGFHRDELATMDDARHLAWGFVAYPPVTPFFGRLSWELFGPSLVGARFFAALAQCVAMVLTGLIARDLGGGRWAQVVSALAAATAPMSVCAGNLLQYVTFDYLWWVATAFFMVRLLKTDDPRWWPAIGAALGLGMMTKYTMIFLIAGIAVGVLLSPARRHLKSPWLWAGVAVSLLIFLPNMLWQAQHDFVSLEFLRSIHERDVQIGRADGYLPLQLIVNTNPFTLPLWLAGLYYYLWSAAGARFRPLGWMYLVPLALFLIARGRFYYMAPAYPMLLAAGCVVAEHWIASLTHGAARALRWAVGSGLAAGAVMSAALMLPLAPVGSPLWNIVNEVHDNFREMLGWHELVEEVARIHAALPEEERARTGILAGNYGEAGAINMYGPARGLPTAISGVNSYWARGYGEPPPETLIVLGASRQRAERYFTTCAVAGRNGNSYGVQNEESRDHPDILVCRELRLPWPEFWKQIRGFG